MKADDIISGHHTGQGGTLSVFSVIVLLMLPPFRTSKSYN